MNRPIKFRAWNSKMKRMFSPEEMATDQMTLLPTGQFINVHGVSEKLSVIYPIYAMLPLQYTGLTDKNGKEVYEGDIVLCGSPRKCPHVIEWKDEVPSTGLGGMPGFYLNGLNEGYVWIGKDGEEVIGNIYENPELIKNI